MPERFKARFYDAYLFKGKSLEKVLNDGEVGDVTYKVYPGWVYQIRARPFIEEPPANDIVTLHVKHHKAGEKELLLVKVEHWHREGVTYKPGWQDNHVYKLGPDHSITGLPGGRKFTHGTFKRGQVAWPISLEEFERGR